MKIISIFKSSVYWTNSSTDTATDGGSHGSGTVETDQELDISSAGVEYLRPVDTVLN